AASSDRGSPYHLYRFLSEHRSPLSSHVKLVFVPRVIGEDVPNPASDLGIGGIQSDSEQVDRSRESGDEVEQRLAMSGTETGAIDGVRVSPECTTQTRL